MTKSQYPYPPDEFDARRPEGAPVGVHREPRSRWSAVWPFLLVAVVFAGIAVGVVSYLSDDRGGDTPPAASSTEDAAGGDGEDTGEETGAEGEPSEEPSAEPTDTATEEPPAEGLSEEDVAALLAQASLTAPIVVQNASPQAGATVDGLAGSTAELLTAQGFSNITTANFDGSEAPSGNAVRYVGDRAETSAAVAAVLGIPEENVRQVDALPQGEIAVVMVTAVE
ncbi:LytR C-terminal domain-containing protein [Isoptericola variabilis]|uniref:LytR/CpsA/Psr regulator C-terminal domain-containing protein n=1 Tax=Isoptericola variabilis (strain 225) TaxID=743718 RepID=F6FTF1_ISOV2|nr:LytR C-terminal domain-containing protein [Isoptericola variabilis]AEG45315.1 hypothetical protein Isova_2612 [Isoptericola variabilis 225]